MDAVVLLTQFSDETKVKTRNDHFIREHISYKINYDKKKLDCDLNQKKQAKKVFVFLLCV